MNKRTIAIMLGLTLVAVTAIHARGDTESGRLIDPAEAYEMVSSGSAVIVDVRVLASYVESHIAGALHIALGDIPANARQFADQPKTVITYCSCPAEESSQTAAIELGDAGITNVRVLKGGFQAWTDVGLPVTSGAGP